jgi:hypothetical protein
MFNNQKKKPESDVPTSTEDVKKTEKKSEGSTHRLLTTMRSAKTPFKIGSHSVGEPKSNILETTHDESHTEKVTKKVGQDFRRKK